MGWGYPFGRGPRTLGVSSRRSWDWPRPRGADSRDGKKTAISELVGWALPIQERHFAEVKDGSLKLAGEKDPYEES